METELRLLASGDLSAAECSALRELLDAAFAGDFSDDDCALPRRCTRPPLGSGYSRNRGRTCEPFSLQGYDEASLL